MGDDPLNCLDDFGKLNFANTSQVYNCIYCGSVIKMCNGSKLYVKRHHNTLKCKAAQKNMLSKKSGS